MSLSVGRKMTLAGGVYEPLPLLPLLSVPPRPLGAETVRETGSTPPLPASTGARDTAHLRALAVLASRREVILLSSTQSEGMCIPLPRRDLLSWAQVGEGLWASPQSQF